MEFTRLVARYEVWECRLLGKTAGNPFTDYNIYGEFESANQKLRVAGFYDGAGVYKVRFMPSFVGNYTFRIAGTFSEQVFQGEFKVTEAEAGNHGPVRVAHKFHFAYEDGTPYYPVGTTCYAWGFQPEDLQQQTLETLRKNCFNKLRFCIFPKHYLYNLKEPECYPFEGTPGDFSELNEENFHEYNQQKTSKWDFTRLNPVYFRRIETQIAALMKLGIEADLIIMHPYDRWGFDDLGREADDLYYHYIISRFAAYRNVWWSLANEYDLMRHKQIADWEHYGEMLVRFDHYQRLRSIHNCGAHYDFTRPWITHCCIQRNDAYKSAEYTDEWRVRYQKPVVIDEMAYEGDIGMEWGNITGQELVRRCWETALRGGYPGHGETFENRDNVLWWSHGGKLYGEAPDRIAFLYRIMRDFPGHGLTIKPIGDYRIFGGGLCSGPDIYDEDHAAPDYRIYYYGFTRPNHKSFYFDDTTWYQAEIIDTWDMTIHDAGVYRGKFTLKLPAKQYMAVRIRRIKR